MNNSIWVALAGWCLICVQLVLNLLEVPIVITHLLTIIIMLVFILAIVLGVNELFPSTKKS